MKHSIKKYFKLTSLVLFSLVASGFMKGDLELTKTFTEEVSVDSETLFKVTNKCGPIQFKKTNGDKARIEATLLVEGSAKKEIEKVVDQFNISVSNSGRSIDVIADDNIKSWVQMNALLYKKNTITFHDGTEAKDITKMEVSMIVYLPEIEQLSVYNKYDDVGFESFNHDVEVEMFSGDFIGGDINGDLNVNLKYGKINIGDIQDGDFTLFDCDSKVKTAKELNLNVKYSDIKFDNIETLVMNSFDDDIIVGNVSSSIDLDAKYSKIQMGNFSNADFELFDCDLSAKDGNKFRIDSKYGEHTIGDVNEADFEFFQDKINMGKVHDFKARNTKYSKFFIDKVTGSFTVSSSFQDKFEVGNVESSIRELSLEGKYTNLSFPIPSDLAYHLDADLRYSNFSFPSSCKNNEDNGDQNYSVDCKVNNPADGALKVKLKLYDGNVSIK